jgi:hypothetical protein
LKVEAAAISDEDKKYLQMERKAKNGWVLKPEDIWYNMYMSHNILRMKDKGTTFGKKRILTWQDACM